MSAPEGKTSDPTSDRASGQTSGQAPDPLPEQASGSAPDHISSQPSRAYTVRTRQISAGEVHRGREGKASPLLYELVRWLAHGLVPLLVDLRVEGREHLPRQGAAIVASNHIASVDIPLVAYPVPRIVHYMAKAELFQVPFVGGFIRREGAFPVRRGEGDREALRIAERLLSEGKVIGIFPEGHRTEEHALIEAHPGVALIALRAGAPVIPVAIRGSEYALRGWRFLWRRPTVTVSYGAPLYLTSESTRRTSADVKRATDEIMGAIAAMLPPRYRGAYADLVPPQPNDTAP
ncbi:MAG TPA: lysophospholipid acyltransferase family protein [Ktedonobacterales bacterium]